MGSVADQIRYVFNTVCKQTADVQISDVGGEVSISCGLGHSHWHSTHAFYRALSLMLGVNIHIAGNGPGGYSRFVGTRIDEGARVDGSRSDFLRFTVSDNRLVATLSAEHMEAVQAQDMSTFALRFQKKMEEVVPAVSER